MAFSLTRRVKSKLHVASGGEDDANVLGEVLHRSTKTSKSKKKLKNNDQYLQVDQLNNADSDYEATLRSNSNERSITYRTECPCENHYEKQLVERNYDMNVDKLFDLMFGMNEFVRTYRQAQRFYDDTTTDWTINDGSQYRERLLTYKMPFESTLVGKGTITTHEKQTLTFEAVGSHYVLEAEVYNEGVKYSNTFTLYIRYCLVQTSIKTTNLRVTAQIHFSKSVNALAKQVIEKNAYSASQEALKDLNNRLNLINQFKTEKQRLSRSDLTLNIPVLPPGSQHGRRMSRHDALANTTSVDTLLNSNQNLHQSPIFIFSEKTMQFLILFIGILILFHLYLYLKLKHMDTLVENLSHLIRLTTSLPSAKH